MSQNALVYGYPTGHIKAHTSTYGRHEAKGWNPGPHKEPGVALDIRLSLELRARSSLSQYQIQDHLPNSSFHELGKLFYKKRAKTNWILKMKLNRNKRSSISPDTLWPLDYNFKDRIEMYWQIWFYFSGLECGYWLTNIFLIKNKLSLIWWCIVNEICLVLQQHRYILLGLVLNLLTWVYALV